MSKTRRDVEPPDVPALSAPRLLAGERVQSWHFMRADHLTVLVMEHDPDVHAIIDEFGLGGCGRTLEFQFKSGRWTFTGESAWRS